MSYTRLAAAVNEILYEDWDPIGVAGSAPRDEYESYVPALIRLARGKSSTEAVAVHLAELEAEAMGLTPTPATRRLALAARIVATVRESGWTPPAS
jgi:hypothetical protein